MTYTKAYSPGDDRYIADNWKTMTDYEMGDALGRTHGAIATRRNKLGLSRNAYNHAEAQRQIVELWGHQTPLEIARVVRRDVSYVYRVAREFDLGPRAPRAKRTGDCAAHIVRPDRPGGIRPDAIEWARANYPSSEAVLILGMAGVRP